MALSDNPKPTASIRARPSPSTAGNDIIAANDTIASDYITAPPSFSAPTCLATLLLRQTPVLLPCQPTGPRALAPPLSPDPTSPLATQNPPTAPVCFHLAPTLIVPRAADPKVPRSPLSALSPCCPSAPAPSTTAPSPTTPSLRPSRTLAAARAPSRGAALSSFGTLGPLAARGSVPKLLSTKPSDWCTLLMARPTTSFRRPRRHQLLSRALSSVPRLPKTQSFQPPARPSFRLIPASPW